MGAASYEWIDTIRNWTKDPTSKLTDDASYTYNRQIEFEDTRVISVYLSPLIQGNDFLGTISVFHDITHQVTVDRLKSEFIGTISHELQTPMTSIKGYIEILLTSAVGQLNKKQTDFLEIMRTNTERLSILVNDLLDVSRIEDERVRFFLQSLDARQLAREAMGDLERRNREEAKGMDLQLQLPPNLPHVLGDTERIHQIFDNLLDNAYYYTPAGGRIEVSMAQFGDEVQIEVQDNGIGIPLEDQPRIFERFFRGKDPLVQAISGTGLGLAIVRHLVEMHNGRIWFKSSGILGEGSVFTFTLPVIHSLKEAN